jgi:DNA-binding transcriptional MocR family regulator
LFLTGGGYDQHIRTLESVYRPLFEAVLTRARSRLTPLGFTIASVHGGTSLWLRLPDHLDPEAFHRETVRCGISLAPGDPFSTDGSTAGGTCLCFGRLTLADLDRVLDVLEDIVS